jgi:phosphoserine phosphatase RsbU/P
MKILVAEDDALFRRLLQQVLAPEYEIVTAENGGEAWNILQQPGHAELALLDWVMPVMTGPQICRKVREDPQLSSMYLMILTAKNSTPDVISGLRAGADDYITKPFVPEELRARVHVGARLIRAESSAHLLDSELQQAAVRETRLQKLLPICPVCKTIRSDSKYWREVNTYVHEYQTSAVERTGCPHCLREELDTAFPEKTKTAEASL